MNDQVVQIPTYGGRMQLDRVVIMSRRVIHRIDFEWGRFEGCSGVPDLDQQRLTLKNAGLGAFPCMVADSFGKLRLLGATDERFGVIGLLLSLGEYDRDRLTVPMNQIVLHDGKAIACRRFRRRHEGRRGLYSRCVQMRHDQVHAGRYSTE